tara:strand:- start:4530 stop:4871 length:342 start_codon:yes stop_codon:yes gene_type:complete
MKFFLIVLVIVFQSSFVYAHSPLKSIIPKDGIVLNKAPVEIKVYFKLSAKLLKITLNKFEGNEVKLSKEPLMKNSKNHSIPLPPLKPDIYNFKWCAMSEDGHIIKGKSNFKLE